MAMKDFDRRQKVIGGLIAGVVLAMGSCTVFPHFTRDSYQVTVKEKEVKKDQAQKEATDT